MTILRKSDGSRIDGVGFGTEGYRVPQLLTSGEQLRLRFYVAGGGGLNGDGEARDDGDDATGDLSLP